MISNSRSDGLKDIALGATAITIIGLVIIIAALIYTLETYTPEANLIFPPYIKAAYGQEQEEQQEDNTTRIFQSNIEGFRIQVPNGWILDDIDNSHPINQQREKSFGFGILAILCPQTETLPIIGGGYRCSDGAEDDVTIVRFTDLKSRPEFAVLAAENKSITISDFVAYYIQFLEERVNFTDTRLAENIDREINVTDPQTNQIIATAPAKYVELTYSDSSDIWNYRDFYLVVLSNDGNTGYILNPTPSAVSPSFLRIPAADLPPEHQQIIDSFELVK